MSRYEVYETLQKYGITCGNGITVFSELDEIYRLCRFFELGQLVSFEKPDAYIKIDNEILIIEHFSVDGYKSYPNGGSKLQRNKSEQQAIFDNLQLNEDWASHIADIGVLSSYKDFISNCISAFDHHYEKIPSYKKHLIDEDIADENTQFTICFLIDDISPMGTFVTDGEKIIPICLGKSEEFLSFFEAKENVDWVVSAVTAPEGYTPYFFSRKEINTCKNNIIDYSACQFLTGNYTQIAVKTVV